MIENLRKITNLEEQFTLGRRHRTETSKTKHNKLKRKSNTDPTITPGRTQVNT